MDCNEIHVEYSKYKRPVGVISRCSKNLRKERKDPQVIMQCRPTAVERMTLRTGLQLLWISYHFSFLFVRVWGPGYSVRVLSLAAAVWQLYLLRIVMGYK